MSYPLTCVPRRLRLWLWGPRRRHRSLMGNPGRCYQSIGIMHTERMSTHISDGARTGMGSLRTARATSSIKRWSRGDSQWGCRRHASSALPQAGQGRQPGTGNAFGHMRFCESCFVLSQLQEAGMQCREARSTCTPRPQHSMTHTQAIIMWRYLLFNNTVLGRRSLETAVCRRRFSPRPCCGMSASSTNACASRIGACRQLLL